MTTKAERIASLVKVMSPKQLLKALLAHHDAGDKVLSRAMGRELLRRCEVASPDVHLYHSYEWQGALPITGE